jgi:hypothetical protein
MAEIKGKDNFAVTPTVNGTNVSLDGHDHDHDALTNFVANEHVDHSTLTLTAGEGLSGGGALTVSRTLDLDVNGLAVDASPDSAADYVVTHDTSAGALKKVLISSLGGGGGGGAPPFTEAWTTLGRPTSASTWQTKTISGVTANTVVQITITNNSNASKFVGIREVGSSVDRRLDLGKNAVVSFGTKTNASSQIEWYSEDNSADITFYYGGEMA